MMSHLTHLNSVTMNYSLSIYFTHWCFEDNVRFPSKHCIYVYINIQFNLRLLNILGENVASLSEAVSNAAQLLFMLWYIML